MINILAFQVVLGYYSYQSVTNVLKFNKYQYN